MKIAKAAQEDSHTYLEMNPNDPEAILLFCQKFCDVDVARHVDSKERHDTAIEMATKLIENPSISRVLKVAPYTVRAGQVECS